MLQFSDPNSVTLKSVDHGRMAEILVQRTASPDELTQLTAITWVRSRLNGVWKFLVSYYIVIITHFALLIGLSDFLMCKNRYSLHHS